MPHFFVCILIGPQAKAGSGKMAATAVKTSNLVSIQTETLKSTGLCHFQGKTAHHFPLAKH